MPLKKDKSNEYQYTYNSSPKCPYCDHEDIDWCENVGLEKDGSEVTVECESCCRDYTVHMHLTYEFSTYHNDDESLKQ